MRQETALKSGPSFPYIPSPEARKPPRASNGCPAYLRVVDMSGVQSMFYVHLFDADAALT